MRKISGVSPCRLHQNQIKTICVQIVINSIERWMPTHLFKLKMIKSKQWSMLHACSFLSGECRIFMCTCVCVCVYCIIYYYYMKRAKTIVTAIPNKAYIKIMDICIASERASVCILFLFTRSLLLWPLLCRLLIYLSKNRIRYSALYNTACELLQHVKMLGKQTKRCRLVCACVCECVSIHKHQIIHFLLAVTHLAHLIFSLPPHSLAPVPRYLILCIDFFLFFMLISYYFFFSYYFSFFFCYSILCSSLPPVLCVCVHE